MSRRLSDTKCGQWTSFPRRLAQLRQAKRYPSYAAAMKECGDDYDSALIASVVCQKTPRYRDDLGRRGLLEADATAQRIAIALGLVASRGGPIVLDYGGAAGAHFFAARRLFGNLPEPSLARG